MANCVHRDPEIVIQTLHESPAPVAKPGTRGIVIMRPVQGLVQHHTQKVSVILADQISNDREEQDHRLLLQIVHDFFHAIRLTTEAEAFYTAMKNYPTLHKNAVTPKGKRPASVKSASYMPSAYELGSTYLLPARNFTPRQRPLAESMVEDHGDNGFNVCGKNGAQQRSRRPGSL